MMQDLATWLARKPKGRAPKKPLPKKPLPKRTKKRAAEERRYRKLAKQYLLDHPICEVWLKENGWKKNLVAPVYLNLALGIITTRYDLFSRGAPTATEVHHRKKRRGALLCDTRYFLAVCSANHARIEANLGWARKEGFSLNF